MSQIVRLKKGFEINLTGAAKKEIFPGDQPETFALKPGNFLGVKRPKTLVKEGESVKAGTPIFEGKNCPDVVFASPVSGEVVEILRGEKRALLEIRILADREVKFKEFRKYTPSELNNADPKEIKDQILHSGLWPCLIQRPFAIVADPSEMPKSIFISGFDTSPLAVDYGLTLKGEEKYFQAGIDALAKLTEGQIHLSICADREVASVFSQIQNIQFHKFSGPHPSGNVGVHIHHIEPINKGDLIWTIKPHGVVMIGKLFMEGIFDSKKIIAIAGSQVNRPAYVETFLGARVDKFLKNNIGEGESRVISGNVLTGESIGSEGYLNFYDDQITVIPEGNKERFFLSSGWLGVIASRLSFHRAFGLISFLSGKEKQYNLDSNLNGEVRPFVQTGTFERVLPMDIYPVYLLKAILAEDYDEMVALGIFELAEEDLALCEFVDVSKMPVQKILREGIDLLMES
jgi:Na+-transporting NADH:ubiquinone oxidoreductase subunit A